MKVIVNERYGSPEVLKATNVEKPLPREKEVLIKVMATTVTSADCMMRKGDTVMSRLVLGVLRPRKRYQILGIEFSGIIEATGNKVTKFKAGDEVFAFRGFGTGCYAEYKCIHEDASIELKPNNMTFNEAASVVDGATTAYFFLKEKAQVSKGQKVLIIGASGSIGTFAVQLARHLGAEVTGVCSTKNLELVKSLGAKQVIDYTQNDYTKSGQKYDVIFDTIGKSSFAQCKKLLNYGGKYVVTVMTLERVFLAFITRFCKKRRVIFDMSISKTEALAYIKKLIENGQLKTVIDRTYSMDQIVEAHKYVDQGHKRGNVVVEVG